MSNASTALATKNAILIFPLLGFLDHYKKWEFSCCFFTPLLRAAAYYHLHYKTKHLTPKMSLMFYHIESSHNSFLEGQEFLNESYLLS